MSTAQGHATCRWHHYDKHASTPGQLLDLTKHCPFESQQAHPCRATTTAVHDSKLLSASSCLSINAILLSLLHVGGRISCCLQMEKLRKALHAAYPAGLPKLWGQAAFQRLFKILSVPADRADSQQPADVQCLHDLLKGELVIR